ncbi:protein FAM234A isoform X1 [Anolis sagrei]|uniref:protein FAM234A isoform X1 n=1 Tax=Anolis sagrei TaxID=38937 RepID=UPI0035209393
MRSGALLADSASGLSLFLCCVCVSFSFPAGAAMEGGGGGGGSAETEARPLKREEASASGAESNCAGVAPGLGSPRRKREERLSRWRAGAFFLALSLCLAAVFAFSFVIPCPVRPRQQHAWSRSYERAAAFPLLALADADEDRVKDVLVALRAAEINSSSGVNSSLAGGGKGRRCSDAGLPSPCAFLVAHSGTNGSLLWARPMGEELLLLDCAWEHSGGPACLLLGKPDFLAALDLQTGETLWRAAAHFGANATVLGPAHKVPDVNKDDLPDILVFVKVGQQLRSSFYSSSDGTQIGVTAPLPLPDCLGHLLQVMPSGASYLLFHTEQGLFSYSVQQVWRLSVPLPAYPSTSLKEDSRWEAAIDDVTHRIALLSLGGIHSLTKMEEKPGTNFLARSFSLLEMINGQHLSSVWVIDIPGLLREPVIGSFDLDEIDMIIESQVSPIKKKVMIVEGETGEIDWEVELLQPGTVPPQAATIRTADHLSVFLFWGQYPEDINGLGSLGNASQPTPIPHLYLFHPSLPNVLVEMTNVTEPIVVFEGALFERSRHACYVLLTGPQVSSGSEGTVVLSKRRLKEDVAGGRVLWLGPLATKTDQDVREHFIRMRYRSYQ